MSTPTAREAKACCAAAYQNDIVALVLGESYHPGGLALTRRLADRLGLACGERVLDVASGPGATALLLARERGVVVDGVDLGAESVERARAAAAEQGLADRVWFTVGDAERLPFDDATFDAVVCECAFCTFPDKATAAAEFARVLRPGGRVGITDVTVEPNVLDGELRTLAGWVACVADARPLEEYVEILRAAGLSAVHTERHDDALARMVDQIDARLRMLRAVGSAQRAVGSAQPALAGIDWDAALRMTGLAGEAVRAGAAGYALLTAKKPAPARRA